MSIKKYHDIDNNEFYLLQIGIQKKQIPTNATCKETIKALKELSEGIMKYDSRLETDPLP